MRRFRKVGELHPLLQFEPVDYVPLAASQHRAVHCDGQTATATGLCLPYKSLYNFTVLEHIELEQLWSIPPFSCNTLDTCCGLLRYTVQSPCSCRSTSSGTLSVWVSQFLHRDRRYHDGDPGIYPQRRNNAVGVERGNVHKHTWPDTDGSEHADVSLQGGFIFRPTCIVVRDLLIKNLHVMDAAGQYLMPLTRTCPSKCKVHSPAHRVVSM
mmetsp:Transcript_36521/g.92321  ORF Transcript_36521/g.92321 Transcript_36521/m.92321 type:complete len:211 (-) Transcript_36521:9-641(-)